MQGFFCESSGTDARDARVFALLEKQGKIRITKNGIEGWVSDPYDAFFTHGIRMNLSEAPQFDILFPAHPLSELRRFVKEVTTEN